MSLLLNYRHQCVSLLTLKSSTCVTWCFHRPCPVHNGGNDSSHRPTAAQTIRYCPETICCATAFVRCLPPADLCCVIPVYETKAPARPTPAGPDIDMSDHGKFRDRVGRGSRKKGEGRSPVKNLLFICIYYFYLQMHNLTSNRRQLGIMQKSKQTSSVLTSAVSFKCPPTCANVA